MFTIARSCGFGNVSLYSFFLGMWTTRSVRPSVSTKSTVAAAWSFLLFPFVVLSAASESAGQRRAGAGQQRRTATH